MFLEHSLFKLKLSVVYLNLVPLLFLIYVNYLPAVAKHKLLLYAYDSRSYFFVHGKQIHEVESLPCSELKQLVIG